MDCRQGGGRRGNSTHACPVAILPGVLIVCDRRGSRAHDRLQDHGRAGERIPARCVADAGEIFELSVDPPIVKEANHKSMERFPALATGRGL